MSKLPRIQQTLNDLNTHRNKNIKSLLKKIAAKKENIQVISTSGANRAIIFGVSDSYESGVNYDSWRFKTELPTINAMYYERWYPYDKNIYYLDRAYFHLYRKQTDEEFSSEYICLHCDVNEPDDAPHAKFKQSPHLHFSFAEDPIPHSHIALNNGNLEHVLLSIDNLHNALSQAINMIENQILSIL